MWDLTHDGATVIPGAAVDSGSAGARIPVAPGTYTVKLTVGKQTLTQTVEVKPDPRWRRPAAKCDRGRAGSRCRTATATAAGPARLDECIAELGEGVRRRGQAARDAARRTPSRRRSPSASATTSRSSPTPCSRLRAIKKQIDLRKELLKDHDDAKELLKQSEALGKKLDEIEEKLHNPKAKISYDIFAAKGGAMLYSQYAWLLRTSPTPTAPPTKAQMELADDLGKQLAELVTQFEGVAKDDVGKLNDAAKKLGVPELYVPPPAKKKEETKPVENK